MARLANGQCLVYDLKFGNVLALSAFKELPAMRSRLLCLLLIPFVTEILSAQEWTRFRGPNGTGVAQNGESIPTQWSEADYNWRTKLPGIGHSSPIVWGNKVFLLSADAESAKRYFLCVNATTGAIQWQREFESNPHHLHVRSSYASCTPAVDADHVYVGWSTPSETTFKAFDHDGFEVWSLDLGSWQSQHGFGTSPILFEDLVILHNSQQAKNLKPGEKPGDSFMMAFRRTTGEEVWRKPLVSAQVCYSVPFFYTPPGGGPVELVCTSTGNGVFSLNPRTGEENWSLNNDLFEMRTVNSPILAGGLIFGSTGSGAFSRNYIVAVRPGKNAELAYMIRNSGQFKAPYVPCLIAKDDLVFCIYDRGFASCIDAPTGKIYWTERTGHEFSGSPIRVGNRIICVDDNGVAVVLAADKEQFKILARNDLGEPSRATPAVSGGRLYLRTYSHLISVGGKTL